MHGARGSLLIRECLEKADGRRLDGDDVYILLAYEALVRLEELSRACKCLHQPASGERSHFDMDGHF